MAESKPKPEPTIFDVREYPEAISLCAVVGHGTSAIGKGDNYSHVDAVLTKRGERVQPSELGIEDFDHYFEKGYAKALAWPLYMQLHEKLPKQPVSTDGD